MKKCTKCSKTKPLSDFYKGKERYETRCKPCLIDYQTAWNKANEAKRKVTSKRRYDADSRRFIEASLKYAKDNPVKYRVRAMARHAAKLQRTPKWLTDFDWLKIRQIYKHAAYLTKKTGIKYEVDHFYPLQGEIVSGLHVPSNLRIITKSENCSKNNKYEIT